MGASCGRRRDQIFGPLLRARFSNSRISFKSSTSTTDLSNVVLYSLASICDTALDQRYSFPRKVAPIRFCTTTFREDLGAPYFFTIDCTIASYVFRSKE